MEAVNAKMIVLDVTVWPKVSHRSPWVNNGLNIRLSTAVETAVRPIQISLLLAKSCSSSVAPPVLKPNNSLCGILVLQNS